MYTIQGSTPVFRDPWRSEKTSQSLLCCIGEMTLRGLGCQGEVDFSEALHTPSCGDTIDHRILSYYPNGRKAVVLDVG